MKRHLIVAYISIVVLLLAGHVAWQNCLWEIMSGVSSAAIVASILIIGWRVIRLDPDQRDLLYVTWVLKDGTKKLDEMKFHCKKHRY